MESVVNRFLRYVKMDTSADPESVSFPSSLGQGILGDLLVKECESIGLKNVYKDEFGYVFAMLPSNMAANNPVPIAFLAHMDTSPDFSGKDVNPSIVKAYPGGEISLGNGASLLPEEFPSLNSYIGQDLIVTDGHTLLGADDKAGIAEILTAMEEMLEENNPHGDIYICFTPDEEIGKGVDHLDLGKIPAVFGYTVDGGRIGELEYENFNAASATIRIKGKNVHPGTAKGILINASVIAGDFISLLPKDEAPETTEGYKGFYHVVQVEGNVSEAKIELIIRDFNKESYENRKEFILQTVGDLQASYGRERISVQIQDQYFNMKDVLTGHMEIVRLAEKAMVAENVQPLMQPIRGGTDGSRLSYMGLPCPNIFTGGHNFHGPYEYIPIPSMKKAVSVIKRICWLHGERAVCEGK